MSTVTNAGRLQFRVFAGKFTADVFIDFLRRLLRSVTEKVFLIADGHPVHRSRKVGEWVERHADRVRLIEKSGSVAFKAQSIPTDPALLGVEAYKSFLKDAAQD